MEKSFKTEYILDLKTYREFSKGYQISGKIPHLILIILILITTLLLALGEYRYIIYFSLFSLIYLFLYFFIISKNKIHYQRMLENYNGRIPHNVIEINDKEIVTKEIGSKNKANYSFEQIIGIFETKNQIVLKLKYNLGLIIDKNNLTGGTQEELVSFLYSVCPNIKNKKIIQVTKEKKYCGYFILIYVLILILSWLMISKENYLFLKIKDQLEKSGYEIIKLESLDSSSKNAIYFITNDNTENEFFLYKFQNKKDASNNFKLWIESEEFSIFDCEKSPSNEYQKCETNESEHIVMIQNNQYIFYGVENKNQIELNLLLEKINYLK